MRVLTEAEQLLVSGGYGTSGDTVRDGYPPAEPGSYDTTGGGWGATPPPPAAPDPLQGASVRAPTDDDVFLISELFLSASGDFYSVEHAITQGQEQGSGSNGTDPFTFAGWAGWSPGGGQSYSPDSNVMNALDAAGLHYTVQSNGSIYVPGYGYAVANGTGGTSDSGYGSYDSGYQSVTTGSYDAPIVVLGHVPGGSIGFDPNDIVVTGQYQMAQAQAAPVIGRIIEGIVVGILGNEADKWLFPSDDHEAADNKARAQQALHDAEARLSNLYNPADPNQRQLSVLGRDGSMYTGMLQGGKFFVDVNHNGVYDIAFAHNPVTGQIVTNYGNGWVAAGNPFVGPVPF